MGAVLCTDYLPELENLFDLDEDISVFKSSQELRRKLKELSSDSKKAESIAHGGFEKTHSDHSVQNRVHRFIEIVNQYRL